MGSPGVTRRATVAKFIRDWASVQYTPPAPVALEGLELERCSRPHVACNARRLPGPVAAAVGQEDRLDLLAVHAEVENVLPEGTLLHAARDERRPHAGVTGLCGAGRGLTTRNMKDQGRENRSSRHGRDPDPSPAVIHLVRLLS